MLKKKMLGEAFERSRRNASRKLAVSLFGVIVHPFHVFRLFFSGSVQPEVGLSPFTLSVLGFSAKTMGEPKKPTRGMQNAITQRRDLANAARIREKASERLLHVEDQ